MVYSYVTPDGDGFTTDQQNALHVNGKPVLSPGITFHVSNTYITRHQLIWDLLLDVMEELFSVEDTPEYQGGIDMLTKKIEGIVESLALLNYGNADREAVRLIKARAEIEYDAAASEVK